MKSKLVDVIIIGFIIASVVVAVQYYYNIENKECMGNPLVYAARQYEKTYEREFIGSLSVKGEGIHSTIYFDAYGVSIEDPLYNNTNYTIEPINITKIIK
tara:strand:- start:717 stop:1016 length:300 start_codon:yes stop_codon:yes gene_type:complete